MKRKNAMRNALFTSILSLLLCVSMLVSTTFAWFTDEVISGQNVIAAGNLDVVLEYWNGEKYAEVTETTKLFNDAALWEPGHTEVAYLKVSNAGSLALKYQLAVNVYNETLGKTKDGKDIKLSDHLVFSVVEKQLETKDDMYSREAAITAAGTTKGLTAYNSGTTPLMPKGYAEVDKTEDYVALIVYMPTTVENEANHDGVNVPSIQMGVHLTATQLVNESDSFGSEYDKNAWANAMKVNNAAELLTAIENVEDGGLIALVDDVTFDKDTCTNSGGTWYEGLYYEGDKSFTLDLGGKTLTADAAVNDYLMLFKNAGDKANTITIKNGTLEAASTAYCALCTSTTSTQKITINLENVALVGNNSNGAVAKIRGGAELNVKAGTVINGKNSYVGIECVAATVNIYDGAEIYQKGTSSYVGSLAGTSNNGTINVYGGYGESAMGGFIAMTSGGTINVSGGEWIANTDGTYANGNKSVLIAQSDKRASSVINVTGGTFKGGYNCYGNVAGDAQINISGGTFNADPASYVVDGHAAVANADGSYLVLKGNYTETVAPGVYKSDKGYGITTTEGFAWIEAQADNFFAGKTITLEADIDFAGATVPAARVWNPENKTVIDGNGKTLSNLVISNTAGNAGLFNGTFDVKNLTVDNATVTGTYAGVLAGNMYGNIDNCTVKNSTVNGTYWQTGMLCGQYNAGSITNCVVDNCTINGLSAVGALVGILNESAGTRTIANCTITNCAINQTGSFGGSYDNYFGVAVGLINTENATIVFDGNTIENNTLKGAASDELYGVAEPSNQVIIN